MKIVSDNKVVYTPIEIIKYETFLRRFKGLMFRRKPIAKEGIFLFPCNSIHMFFMFFPIDVVFLNEQKQIVYLKESVKPWTVIFPIKKAVSVLELPANTISNYSLEVGDTIEF
ncbi:DUF192 domain-containing protein [Halalkalibacter alkaliphilus]|uniref:DUF192 domain-containing protein n=1 Tax=Halalkalibacter alkaliphilus TaxID=2917993 RepID=A0A9X1ZWB6_9BACI|nr:DUF192 domain-containing protein [Halalkalibacter alkaliphilus]MCL7746734.1 DUF192 domain-containing protein [Halalkalibacter alkaliphilus]